MQPTYLVNNPSTNPHSVVGKRFVLHEPLLCRFMVLDFSHNHCGEHQHHEATAFPCRMAAQAPPAQPARDGPIVPSNCKTHLTCKPIHPNRGDVWGSWGAYLGDWFTTAMLYVAGAGLAVTACVYGMSAMDKAKKKRRDARLKADGRKPPSDDEGSSGDSDEDARGNRG